MGGSIAGPPPLPGYTTYDRMVDVKPTKETNAFLKALSVYDNFAHIGQELAVFVDDNQAGNLEDLVEGYNAIRVFL